MITEKQINEVLSQQLESMIGEPFEITYYIKEQIVENFKKAGLVKDE